jgi:hypothetical protein
VVDVDEEEQLTSEIASPMFEQLEVASSAGVEDERRKIEGAKRDTLGFIEGESPHLSIEQAVWITCRTGTLTDAEACAQCGVSLVSAGIWRKDPQFEAILQQALANKREGFRMLGTQMLPKALAKMADILDSKNNREVLAAAKLLIETQGMLITKVDKTSKESITELVAFLREPQEITVNNKPRITVRGLPSPEDLENVND